MESRIDRMYRNKLEEWYLEGLEQKKGMHVFYCPFCQLNRKQGKYYQKKGAMIWIEKWNAWRFNCKKCDHKHTTLYKFLLGVNPSMAYQYQAERYAAGKTGKGTDCPNPQFLKAVRSAARPQFRSQVGIHTHN